MLPISIGMEKPQYNRYATPTQSHIEIGAGVNLTIAEPAELIAKTVRFNGDILFRHAQLEGVPRKILYTSKLAYMG
jgi:GDP-L-fucose synthase